MARLKYYSKKTNAWETVDSTFGTGNVKTVNGVEPDANGNIEIAVPGMPEINYPVTSVNGMTGDVVIEVGSGQNAVQSSWAQNDPTKPDYVKGRTHWEEGTLNTIVWDEVTEGKVEWNGYYKVSDATPPISEMVGGKIIIPEEGEPDYEIEFTQDDIDDATDDIGGYFVGDFVAVCLSVVDGVLPETGVYITGDRRLPSGTTLVYGNQTIHKLDEKFIPASIARTSTVKSPLVVRVRYTSDTPSFENDTKQVRGGYSEHTIDQIAEAYSSGRLVVAHIVNLSNEVEVIVPMTRCKSSDKFGPASCEFFIYDDRWERYATVYGEASNDGGYDSWTIIYSHEYSESSIGDILYVGYNGNAFPAKIGAGLQLVYESQYESLSVKPAAAIADLTAAPTVDDFNNLLAALRTAGFLATE